MIGELKSLGKDYAESLQAAQMLVTARFVLGLGFFFFWKEFGGFFFFPEWWFCVWGRCDHEEKRVSAAQCVESIIGGSNTEHFFVATQDAEIRKMFREVRLFSANCG